MSEPPIRIGHADEGFEPEGCGCCEGTALSTQAPVENRPNLSAIAFRVGDYASFKASMLTGLASAAHPALARLRTRDDDDFSIALIDAWASACDVLTFYQERLANEAYIGTATERLSIAELARLIGYKLHPGTAAETDLVILMEDPPGARPDVAELQVPAGTRVQSQPGPDEKPQVFETLAELEARVEWNALRPRASKPDLPGNGETEAWLEGTPTLQPGDAVVFVGRARWDEDFPGFSSGSGAWSFKRLTAVEPSKDGTRTRIEWSGGLSGLGATPTAGLKLYRLTDRAALFGYNAPHPLTMSEEQRDAYGYADSPLANSPSTISGTDAVSGDWVFTLENDRFHLDAIYKSFVENSWIVARRPAGLTQLYRITDTRDDTLAKYAVSGKAMRLSLDTTQNLSFFEAMYRGVSIYGGSAEIQIAERPLKDWISGSEVELDGLADDLLEGRALILSGRRAMLEVLAQSVTLVPEAGASRVVEKGARLVLLNRPTGSGSNRHFSLMDEDGFIGVAITSSASFGTVPASEAVEVVAVAAALKEVQPSDATHSKLVLEEPLGVAFDRTDLVIHANVARAAHGEGVTQILGHGDPSQPFQKFLLKQAPVTHHLAPTETGVKSTLSIRIDGVEWQEMPDLYDRGARARVFSTTLLDTGETLVEFGDGVSGARPPAGRDNIVASHSKGLGADGNVRAGQLKLSLDRPLGLKETYNPLPATGGADAATAEAARRAAPITTLTLGRVVSLTDYRDYALGYPGIAKAESRWVWQGETRRIVVTVAGIDGKTVEPGSTTFINLLGAFRSLGDPLVSVELLSYAPASFRLGLRVKVTDGYDKETVLAATELHLREAFAFEARDFGQVLSLAEMAAAAHEVEGVEAVDIDSLYRTTPPQTLVKAHARLISQTGRLGPGNMLLPAEILTLDEGPLDKLVVMS